MNGELGALINRVLKNNVNTIIRIMIVSSLSGGTGSGMFIQTALWLRKHLAQSNVVIRGIFRAVNMNAAEHMRMAINELVGDSRCDITQGEVAAFFFDNGMENDLQQQVAEFLFKRSHVYLKSVPFSVRKNLSQASTQPNLRALTLNSAISNPIAMLCRLRPKY